MSERSGQAALLAHFEARRDALPGGAGWLRGLRDEAIESFAARGIPTTRDEDWRFTSLKALEALPLEPAAAADPPRALVERAAASVGPAHRSVFVNGRRAAEPASGPPPAGVRVRSLADALERDAAALEGRLASAIDAKASALAALNTALFEDGALVEIDPDVALERPLHLVFASVPGGTPGAAHPRSLVVAGAGSRAVVIEHWIGAGAGAHLNNPLTELLLGRDASLDHVRLQDEAEGAFHVGGLAARQEAGSRLASHSLALGARLSRLAVRTELAGEGAHAALHGLYLARGAQHVDHHTTIDHATPHTTSDELYKGVLDGRARGVFHGRIHVRPHAQKINAMQTNRNLLLSDRATINTKPQLEIFANDVRCSHGASIGRLDADALFYLQARGIDLEHARALLTRAFAAEITSRLPVEPLRRHLDALVPEWLRRGRD